MLGPVIGAVGSLVGSLLNSSANEDALAAQEQQNAAINKLNERQLRLYQNQFDYQKILNAHRVQMTVKDARAAGIHPLAALGSAGSLSGNIALPSFATPVAESGGGLDTGSGIGNAIAQLGSALPGTQQGQLQEDLLRAQIRNVDASTVKILADATSRSTIGNAQVPGVGFLSPSTLPDTDQGTKRHGEMADFLWGPQVLWSDMKQTYREKGLSETLNQLDAGGVVRDLAPLLVGGWMPSNFRW